ncbi:nucleotide exchange factor SIL1 isoform X1 [Scyliorhinus canicula]|uniref:nucleotide exchange factor SIL1 isoform X1 n=2 Tax=Scyliorhinus canicula TaxID=7830 RepID=UPI0018F3693D|nr:nucleotide exchange factor SIL1 isoform X1 [Scyliorhinus canicula]XP_038651261.1 nucleotide exchange factor SIL1 isoform X1 [Scyliorhinus canicula]XP_038651262.1 nucleotide exchange factor SIL1 isoform X1 [Scyliorhinus canicula]
MKLACLNLILLLISVHCLNCSRSEDGQQQRVSALTVLEQPEENIGKRKEEATVEDDLDPEDMEVFYPTNEWQIIKPGQAIPAGLHVRLNLETGKNEAKFPDDGNGKNGLKYWKQGNRHGMVNTDSKSFTAKELKRALKLIKQEGLVDIDESHQEKVQKTFRPIKELMEDFEAMNVVMETDMEIINKLVSKFNSTNATLENKVAALYNLEYYVHQVDNAQHLTAIGGLQLVINALNATEPHIRENAAFVLGSALSSNPKVQIEAMEAGALQKLLMLLATDQPVAIKKKALFGFSSMLRHFPFAQQQFLKLGGLQVLGQLFQAKEMESLRIRVMTLLYDMVMEKKLIQEVHDWSTRHQEKCHQYDQVNLLPSMLEQDWCMLVPQLLMSTEHDTREKVLRTMNLMISSCRSEYQAMQGLSSLLNMLRSEYEELAAEEQREGEQDGYFLGLLHSASDIIKKLE